MIRVGWGARLAVGVVGVAVLSGCGFKSDLGGAAPGLGGEPFPGLSAEEIGVLAGAALQNADSMRMATPEGSTIDGTWFDLHVDWTGSCVGSAGEDEVGSVDLLVRGDDVWFQPDEGFLAASISEGAGLTVAEAEEFGEAAVDALDGRFMHGTTSDSSFASMADTCSIAEDPEDEDPAGQQVATRGEETTYAGVPVLTIEGSEAGEEFTLLVATEGEPYPLLMSSDVDGVPVTIEFSDFDEPVVFQQPAPSEVVETSEFQRDLMRELFDEELVG